MGLAKDLGRCSSILMICEANHVSWIELGLQRCEKLK